MFELDQVGVWIGLGVHSIRAGTVHQEASSRLGLESRDAELLYFGEKKRRLHRGWNDADIGGFQTAMKL